MIKIKNIIAQSMLDTNGYPAIETTVVLSNGIAGYSSVPAGTSKGTYEAHEVKVSKAIENVNKIIKPALIGFGSEEQQKIDKLMIELDGTKNKTRLGGNAMLSVSQAAAKAAAKSANLPLYCYLSKLFFSSGEFNKYPTPLFVMLEGGKHAQNSLDFQEILLIPSIAETFEEKMEIAVNVYHLLKNTLSKLKLSALSAMEGGFAPNFSANIEALQFIKKIIKDSGYKLSQDVSLGIDIAANSLYNKKAYILKDKLVPYKQEELIDLYQNLVSKFHITYLEDLFAEDDWKAWEKGFKKLSKYSLVVGDDLTVTNKHRLKQAIKDNVISGVVIKPNQVGTITESIETIKMARLNNLKIVVSHRSGETMDDFIADFAIAVKSDFVKFGAPARERVIKYNRLIKIIREIE